MVRSGGTGAASPRDDGAVRTAPDGPWPFVGRNVLLDELTASISAPHVDGWLVLGAAGVGKSRLGLEVLAAADRLGHRTGHVVASAALSGIPLACLSHLLPAEALAGGDEMDVVRIAALLRAGLDGPLVLLVDEIDHLDHASAVVLVQLVAARSAFVIGTARDATGVNDAILSLVRNERIGRLDLAPLDDDDVDSLLHLSLGAPVTAAVGRQLWNRSAGNVLFLRELVRAGRASGSLVEVDHVWVLAGDMPTPAALRDLVVERLAALSPAERDLMERLALCGSLGWIDIEQRGWGEALSALDELGLVDIEVDGLRRTVAVSHPIHADVLRDGVRPGRARELYLEEAEALEAHGLRRRTDQWRASGWRLEAGAPIDPSLLLAAAETARAAGDMASASRLAERAWHDRGSPRDGLVFGEALAVTGRSTEADAVLAAAHEAAAADAEARSLVPLIADARAMNAFWGLSDPTLAIDVLDGARAVLAPDDDPALVGAHAWMLAFDGRPVEALALLDAAGADDLRARAVTAIPRSTALALTGRTTEAIEVSRRGQADREALGADPVAAAPRLHLSAEIFGLTEQGRLLEGTELALAAHAGATNDDDLFGVLFMGLSLARLWLRRGRPRTALRWYREIQPLVWALAPMHRLTLVGITVSSVLIDDLPAARAAAEELRALPPAPRFLEPEVELAEGWLAWAEGRPDDARTALLRGAAAARESGQSSAELALLLDAARLGSADVVHERVRELAESSESDVAAAAADLVDGLAADDPELLARAGARFEGIDAQILAAESFVALTHSLRKAQRSREATAAEATATLLIESTEGARTPGLTLTGSIVPLSRREMEIALLAADGHSSKVIAERLFLSVRTVNNHLGNVYTKLGIGGRAELRDALGRATRGREGT